MNVLQIVFRYVPVEKNTGNKSAVIHVYDKDGNMVGLELLNVSRRTENPLGASYAATE